MLTRSGHGESFSRKAGHGFVVRICTSDRLSLRLRDAPLGAVALVSIVSGVLLIPVAASFLGKGTPLSRALTIVILLFAPAILGAVYSLFFEKSKVYGSVDLLLAGTAILVHPFTWHWLGMYVPFASAFTVFCAAVLILEHRRIR
jgi:hypothetical protein